MIFLIYNKKIIRTIIKAITINMVDFFSFIKFSAKDIFHDYPVFRYWVAVSSHITVTFPLTICVNYCSALVSRIVCAFSHKTIIFQRTKFRTSSLCFKKAFRDFYFFLANRTSNYCHGIIVSFYLYDVNNGMVPHSRGSWGTI